MAKQQNEAFAEAMEQAEPLDPWPEIVSLDGDEEEGKPYPVDALPEIVRDAVISYQAYAQQPLGLVASSAISAMSFAAQGLADVARDEHLDGPVSLNFLIIAKSGERKSSADSMLMKSCREWEREKTDERSQEIDEARREHAVFVEMEKALKKKLNKSIEKGTDEDRITAEKELKELLTQKPAALTSFQALYEDINQQALLLLLAVGYPSAALFSDEAAIVIGGNGLNDDNATQFFGVFNRLWDGNDYRRNRVTTPGADVVGRRLTVSMMMQFPILQELLDIKDGQSRGTGFLARMLFTFPASTMGTRFYKSEFNKAAVDRFHRRIRELLDMPLPVRDEKTMRLKPPMLRLCDEAKKLWIKYYNDTERELGATGEFSDVDDFAAKSAENAVRLAAIFHVFNHGADGEISADTMSRGIAVASWHLAETRRVFASLNAPPEVKNAKKLLEWMLKKEIEHFSTADLGQIAPNALREKKMWEPALKVLVANGHVIGEKTNEYRVNPKARGVV